MLGGLQTRANQAQDVKLVMPDGMSDNVSDNDLGGGKRRGQ